MKLIALLFLATVLFGCQVAALPAGGEIDAATARQMLEESLRDSYIVTFKDDGADAEAAMQEIKQAVERENAAAREGEVQSQIKHEYAMPGFRGFAGRLAPAVLAQVRASAAVRRVEADGIAQATGQQDSPPSWGLTRVSERDLDLTKPYVYPDSAGEGTKVYVIDTGIWYTHEDFGGRAKWGVTKCDVLCFADIDDNGHGTHVAGTIGGTKYGLAKNTELIAVKVLNFMGSGSMAGVIAGVNYVADEAKKLGKTVVANMSLGGDLVQSLNDAVTAAFKAGVIMAVAAGNEDRDACKVSPASTPEALTVAASDKTDARASFSNWGTCVDVIAPGKDITSAWNFGNDQTKTISGTSMASPHVAGGAALVLGQNPGFSPQEVTDAIVAAATSGKITDLKGTVNKLLYTL